MELVAPAHWIVNTMRRRKCAATKARGPCAACTQSAHTALSDIANADRYAGRGRTNMATEAGSLSFGTLLKRCRLSAGFSQEELAERAGLSRRGITDLERGARRSPHPGTVRRLADALALTEPDRADLLVAARGSSSKAGAEECAPRLTHRLAAA